MHKDMLLTTLIELQRQKAPQIKKISQWWLNTWIRGLCSDKNHMMALDNAAGSIGKMLHTKKEGKHCLLYSLRPPWLGKLSHPWKRRWPGSYFWTRGGYTQVCPSLNTFLSFTVCYIWLAQKSYMASKPWVVSRQNSAGLNFCWCWGFQLKPPPPWECHPLACKQPLQCTVDPEGISLHGLFVRSFKGKKQCGSSPFLFAQSNFTLFHSPGS